MDPTILAALFTLFGVVIASAVSFLTNWYLSRQQREQWERERKAEKEEWLRDKLQEIYSNCIFYLSRETFSRHIPVPSREEATIEYHKLEFESKRLDVEHQKQLQRWLNLLLIYHPRKGTEEFESFLEKMRRNELRSDDIVEIAEADPRLRVL
jgi:hypothetical protein